MQQLTAMQGAYWVGRQSQQFLGEVSAHLYAEFDSVDLDVDRLCIAVRNLFEMHPMLRMRVSPEGLQTIDKINSSHRLRIDDVTDFNAEQLSSFLEQKRKLKSTQLLAVQDGQVVDVSISLQPNNRYRLHVDVDMIAVDAQSFRLLIDDLATLYNTPIKHLHDSNNSYFKYLQQFHADKVLRDLEQEDRKWWQSRIAEMPPAPVFPVVDDTHTRISNRHNRLSVFLSEVEKNALKKIARENYLTTSVLFLSIFSILVANYSTSIQFRLNIPMFHRRPYFKGVEKIIGDFSNLLILGVNVKQTESFVNFCQSVAQQLAVLITHSNYSGINVLRDISRHKGSVQISPVVFTSGLDIERGDLFSEQVKRIFGELVWVTSQGPQVILDVQVAQLNKGIIVNWDVCADAFPNGLVEDMFEKYMSMVRQLLADSSLMQEQVEKFTKNKTTFFTQLHLPEVNTEIPLTALQRAYIIGRSNQMPLSGVSMQDFREFNGEANFEKIKENLFAIVQKYEALRVWIDINKLMQRISSEILLKLEHVDLRHLPRNKGLEKVEQLRVSVSHYMHDLSSPPWQIWIIELENSGKSERNEFSSVVLTSFDALILDGSSISTILVELFADNKVDMVDRLIPYIDKNILDGPVCESKKQEDLLFWQTKLQDVNAMPSLPWKEPLHLIKTSRYARVEICIKKDKWIKLSRLGAKHHLFQNSLIVTIIMETLSFWSRENTVCIGIPISKLLNNQTMANNSTFIAVNYDRKNQSFIQRCQEVQADILNSYEHLSFSDIDIGRYLINKNKSILALPVVITNALSWDILNEHNSLRYISGLTQTPQSALDIRLSYDVNKNLVISMDYAQQALEEDVINDMLQTISRSIDWMSFNDTLELDIGKHVDYRQYSCNSDESKFICSKFLLKISNNILFKPLKKTALICAGKKTSYAELGLSVGNIMHNLRQKGAKKGSVVAICLPKSAEYIMLTISCALMGIIWVPIDIRSPSQRLDYLLKNCCPDFVVSAVALNFPNIVLLEELMEQPKGECDVSSYIEPDLDASTKPAYYLYTSGSTGMPKCVVLNNKSTSNVIYQTSKEWELTSNDVLLAATPFHHDMSVFDIFGSLSVGASLIIPFSEEEKDAISWNKLVEQHKVSIWCSVPAILEMLMSCTKLDQLQSLRLVAQGGDYIKLSTIEKIVGLNDKIRLFSLGGPTETTIWSIWHEINNADCLYIPYGEPLKGNSYFILNKSQEHCPFGVVGRIYTSGINIANGYLNNGVIIQDDFVLIQNEQNQLVRAFKTGDEAYYRRDGKVIFSSRVNGYIKVRGIRISITEIEAAISNHPAIDNIVVVDYIDNNKEVNLAAVYTLQDSNQLTSTELRKFLSEYLPVSHLPTKFLQIKEFLLSNNGKINRLQIKNDFIAIIEKDYEDASISLQLIDIYKNVIGVSSNIKFNESTAFILIGLKTSHIKEICKHINKEFNINIDLYLLVKCKNISQVVEIIRSVK